MQNETFLNAAISRALKREIRIVAASLEISASEFTRRAVEDYLSRFKTASAPGRSQQGQAVERG